MHELEVSHLTKAVIFRRGDKTEHASLKNTLGQLSLHGGGDYLQKSVRRKSALFKIPINWGL